MGNTRYEILIKLGTASFYLDTYESEAISLNYDIANIKDIASRNSAYSKSIKIPDSGHNREVFGFISNLSVDSTFDANLKTPCWILSDSVVVFEGSLQLKNVSKNFKTGEFEYTIVIFADNDTFFTILGEKYVEEIDLNQYNHVYSADNIRYSWTQSVGFPYRYPIIDYGRNWTFDMISGQAAPGLTQATSTSSISVDEIYPAISKKLIFDRIFQGAGYNYNSEFLNSDYFKNQYIPFGGAKLLPDLQKESLFAVGAPTGSQTFSCFTTPFGVTFSNTVPLSFTNELNIPGDPNDVWNPTTFTYMNKNEVPLYERFNIYLNMFNSQVVSTGTSASLYSNFIKVYMYKSIDPNTGITHSTWNMGEGYLFDSADVNGTYNQRSSSANTIAVWTNENIKMSITSKFLFIQPNEQVRFRILWGQFQTNLPAVITSILPNSFISNQLGEVVVGSFFDLSSALPRKMKQRDFISNCCREYNLFIEPSKDYPNTLIIEPRDDFYASGQILDWSDKIDENQQEIIEILAEKQNKLTVFTHKEDKDYLNTYYKQQFNEIYGQYDFDSGNEFAKTGNKKIESIFSPTPLNIVPGSLGIIIPLITKDVEFSYNLDAKGRIETNPRTLQWGGLIPFNNDFDRISFDGQLITNSLGQFCYPYMGHLDNPYNPTTDCNFGQPIEVYFPQNGLTENTLFNRFWYKMMKELTDKDSRLVTCYMKLNPKDISNFRFNSRIFLQFDGNGQYYRVNKISDYNPSSLDPCKVEFLKADDIKVNTFIPKFTGKKISINTSLTSIDVPQVNAGVINIGSNNHVDSNVNVLNVGNNNITGFSKGVINNGDWINVKDGAHSIINNGDNITINGDTKSIIISGDNTIVGTSSTNIYSYGDNANIGLSNSNIYNFGQNNTFIDGVTNSYVFGSFITVTQSNTTVFGGNIIFTGTISGLPKQDLQETLLEGNVVDDLMLTMTGSQIQLGLNTHIMDNSSWGGQFAGDANQMYLSDYGIQIGGGGDFATNSSFSLQLNNAQTEIIDSSSSTIINANESKIISSTASFIMSTSAITDGLGVTISNCQRTGVMLLDNFTATQSDTLYVPNLKVNGQLLVNGNPITGTQDLEETLLNGNVVNGALLSMTNSNVQLGPVENYSDNLGARSAQIAGWFNTMTSNSYTIQMGGLVNTIHGCDTAAQIGGGVNSATNSTRAMMFGGESGLIQNSDYSTVINSNSGRIINATASFIMSNHESNGCTVSNTIRTGIMLLDNVSDVRSNTLYTPRQQYKSPAPTLFIPVGWSGNLTGTDMGGSFSFTTNGSNLGPNTVIAHIFHTDTFHSQLPIVLQPTNANSAAIRTYVQSSTASTQVYAIDALSGTSSYGWHYVGNPY